MTDLQHKIDETLESERETFEQERRTLEENVWQGFSEFFRNKLQERINEARVTLEGRVREETGDNFAIEWPVV